MSHPPVPRVVVLGGGYVAIWLVKQLRRAASRGELELVVIDHNNYHTFHGLVPELLVGKIQAAQVTSPARRLFAPGRFICGEVDHVDFGKKEIRYLTGPEAQPQTVAYDHLVVNLGSVDNLRHYRGVGEHTLRLKGYLDCLRVRNQILSRLERAEAEPDPEERRRLLHFVIAGGNYAGIEVAAEIAELLHDLAHTDFRGLKLEECRVTVIHSSQQILPELGRRFPQLSEYAADVLRSRGVHLELGVRLKSATPAEAILSDDRRLATRTIISCTGSAQHPLLDVMAFPRDRSGRLITDHFARVSEEYCVWSAGDCAAVPMKNGDTAPALAIYAMKGGEHIGKNILRTLKKRPLKPYSFTGFGDCCVLGGRDAVGQIWGIPLKGFPAYFSWCACMILYLPAWSKRIRTLLDWMTVPFFGRDITAASDNSHMGVGRELYETGQVILRQGDSGRAMYLIQSGRVEVVADGTKLAELGSGEHFGEIAVFKDVLRTATVRAIEPVTVLRISREDTRQLSSALKTFSELATSRLDPSPTP